MGLGSVGPPADAAGWMLSAHAGTLRAGASRLPAGCGTRVELDVGKRARRDASEGEWAGQLGQIKMDKTIKK